MKKKERNEPVLRVSTHITPEQVSLVLKSSDETKRKVFASKNFNESEMGSRKFTTLKKHRQ